MRLIIKDKKYNVNSFTEIQEKWVKYIAETSAEEFMKWENNGKIVDEVTGRKYYITYNARIWDAETDELLKDYKYNYSYTRMIDRGYFSKEGNSFSNNETEKKEYFFSSEEEDIIEEFIRVVGVLLQIDSSLIEIKYPANILRYPKQDIIKVVKRKKEEIKKEEGENSDGYVAFDRGLKFLEDRFIEYGDNLKDYKKIKKENINKYKEAIEQWGLDFVVKNY